mgnify:CR=1 FL=1
MKNRVIAIDGPSGAGKSTIAKGIGKRMGFLHVDSGSLYRIMTLAAIKAGIEILAEAYGIAVEDIEQVYLAGGFGYFLEEEAAIRIGLLPKALKGKVQAVGNSALAGCYAYHFDENAEDKITRIKDITRVINLAHAEGFAETFVNHMNF